MHFAKSNGMNKFMFFHVFRSMRALHAMRQRNAKPTPCAFPPPLDLPMLPQVNISAPALKASMQSVHSKCSMYTQLSYRREPMPV